MNEKIYKCVCGKEFTAPNSFNGHKSQCKTHLQLVGKYEKRQAGNQKMHDVWIEKVKQAKEIKAQQDAEKLQKWIDEQHTCKKCGKLMIEWWGTGTYCSASCAHGHPKSNESRAKTRETILKTQIPIRKQIYEQQHKQAVERYLQNPRICCVCSKELSYEQRHRKTCDACVNTLLSNKRKQHIEEHGYNLNTTVKSRYKYGTYKGISCDSSWELAFVMYHIDHDISFSRNKSKYFEYKFEGHSHRFYPDFIVNNTYVEIKSRTSEETDAKIASIPSDVSFKILYEHDLKKYFDYVKRVYGDDYYTLYDRNYPSWMDKQ